MNGRVSEKTDTFSYAILLIELLTSLDCSDARGLVELSELPVAQELRSQPSAVKIFSGAEGVLEALSMVVERCAEPAHRTRSNISAEISHLEAALSQSKAS